MRKRVAIVLMPAVASIALVWMWLVLTAAGVSAQSSADAAGAVLAPSIAVTHTVGLDRSGCASEQQIVVPTGSDVYFCLRLRNTGDVTFTQHVMTRTVQQQTNIITETYRFSFRLTPGQLFTLTNFVLTDTFNIPPRFQLQSVDAATDVDVVFVSRAGTTVATDTTGATVDVASIALTKTVGTQEGACAAGTQSVVPSGTPVYYCFTVQNRGSTSIVANVLADPLLGMLPPFTLPLDVGETAVLTELQPVAGLFVLTPTTATTNTATVFAAAPNLVVSDTATATVYLQKMPQLFPIAWSRSAFADQQALWRAQNLDSYQYTLRVSCFCPPGTEGIVSVQDGEVVSVVDPNTGAPLPESDWFFVKTIDDLFNVLLHAEFSGADVIDVEFDRTLGYPTRLYIDYTREVLDDEILYVVEDLAPLPPSTRS